MQTALVVNKAVTLVASQNKLVHLSNNSSAYRSNKRKANCLEDADEQRMSKQPRNAYCSRLPAPLQLARRSLTNLSQVCNCHFTWALLGSVYTDGSASPYLWCVLLPFFGITHEASCAKDGMTMLS